MLVLLTGPSGGGKTATIFAGRKLFSWSLVETFTTRPQRSPSFDSKRRLRAVERQRFEENSEDYLVTEYDDNLYINRVSDLQHAASSGVNETQLVDWVHKYPTSLEIFGPWAYGIVLCPTLEELRARLEHAGRIARFESAASDHKKIRQEGPSYPKNWCVITGGETPDATAVWISQIVRANFTC